MQEIRKEMNWRITTLGRQIERCEEERTEHQAALTEIDSRIQEYGTLKAQYQQVLDTLPQPDPA